MQEGASTRSILRRAIRQHVWQQTGEVLGQIVADLQWLAIKAALETSIKLLASPKKEDE